MASGPIILITGGNTGLGYETVKALASLPTPYTILLGARNISKGEAAVSSLKSELPSTPSNFHAVPIDVESDDSITSLAADVASRFGHIDVLINNAGANVEGDVQSGKLTWRQAWNKTWDVNVSGAMVMTEAFVPLLLKSTGTHRLIFIASGTASLSETALTAADGMVYARLNAKAEAGWPKEAPKVPTMVYRSAKTGLNMAMREWVRILGNDPVKVFAVSPGMLATGLGGLGADKLRAIGAIEPHVGGEFVRDVAVGERDHQHGLVIRKAAVQEW